MVTALNMQDLRYLNLFSKITRVDTRYFFKYNNMLVFCVPKNMVSRAIGKEAENLKKMNGILGKRIRVVSQPRDIRDVKVFIEAIINPVTFKDLEVKEDKVIVSAGKMSKSALIGRERRRLNEMKKIIKDFFKMDFEIV